MTGDPEDWPGHVVDVPDGAGWTKRGLPEDERRQSVTIRLPRELRDRLDEYAAEYDLCRSSAVERAVRRMLEATP